MFKERFELDLDLDNICVPQEIQIREDPMSYEDHKTNKYSIYMNRGQRKSQQDRVSINIETNSYAVFDGHGDSTVPVDFISSELIKSVNDRCMQVPEEQTCEKIKNVFLQLDERLQRLCKTDKDRNSGCVVLFAQRKDQKIEVASLGDSVAIVVKKNGSFTQINQIQSAQNEIDLIEQRGGLVLKMGNVYRTQGQLAVSRSFGNFPLKNIITCDPELYDYKIEIDDVALIIATDGLWNEIAQSKVAKYVTKKIHKTPKISKKLFKKIHKVKQSPPKDNTTILIVNLQDSQ